MTCKRKEFGEFVRSIRKSAGFTSTALSKMISRSHSYISSVENGNAKNMEYETAYDILAVCGFVKSQIQNQLELYEIYPEDNPIAIQVATNKNKKRKELSKAVDDFGKKFKEMRERKGVTATDLSLAINKSGNYISMVERGHCLNLNVFKTYEALLLLGYEDKEIMAVYKKCKIAISKVAKNRIQKIKSSMPYIFQEQEQEQEQKMEEKMEVDIVTTPTPSAKEESLNEKAIVAIQTPLVRKEGRVKVIVHHQEESNLIIRQEDDKVTIHRGNNQMVIHQNKNQVEIVL